MACKKLCSPEEGVTCHEVDQWMMAFHSNPTLALMQVPNTVYAHMRRRGLITPDSRPLYPATV